MNNAEPIIIERIVREKIYQCAIFNQIIKLLLIRQIY